MKDYQAMQKQFTVDTYTNRGLTFVSGEGVYLSTAEGQSYLDMMSNYGVNIFGYRHPVVTRALIEQLQKLTTLHCSFGNDARAEASRELVGRCGETFSKVYWSNSGAEAVEAALKFAALASGRKRFVACHGGYHGKTLGALSLSSGEKYRKPFEPLLWRVDFVDYGNIARLKSEIDGDVAALIVEPLQGEAGIVEPPHGYLRELHDLCTHRGVLLILDEVQSGTGRTGSFLASHQESIAADIVCLGKGLAGGIPVGATVVNDRVAGAVTKHIHTSTFGGNPLACTGVLTTLQLLDDALLRHVREVGEYFTAALASKVSWVEAVRGRGLMTGVLCPGNRDAVLKRLQLECILACPGGERVVRFLPPYLIQKEHVDRVVHVLSSIAV